METIMNETTLHDLQKKIRNLVHDFELEHGLRGVMDVSTDATRITIEAKESGGLSMKQPYPTDIPQSKEQQRRRDEQDADFNKTLREMYERGEVNTSVYPIDARGHLETGTAHLPIEDTLTEREQEDIKRRKANEHTSDTDLMTAQNDPLTTPPDIGIEVDGRVFNSQTEYENWLSQQKRTRR
jgi:hypothetical protein